MKSVRFGFGRAVGLMVAIAMAFVALSGCDPDDGSEGFSAGYVASSSGASGSSGASSDSASNSGGSSQSSEDDRGDSTTSESTGSDSTAPDSTAPDSTAPDSTVPDMNAPSCIGPLDRVAVEEPRAGAAQDCSTTPGCPAPGWKLPDFQPLSCGFEQIYGLDAYQGRPTLVVLLAAWCGFCRSQLSKLEQLRIRLAIDGVEPYFVVVNQDNAADLQHEFTNISSIPFFQDLPEVGAWAAMAGGKDDFYLYDANGKLLSHHLVSGELSLNLSTEEGMANLEGLLREAMGAEQ